MIREEQLTVVVSGKGSTKAEAVSRALSTIQKEIFAESNLLIVRAEPEHIEEIEAVVEEYTERFFFIFFPRKKLRCEVKLKVTVNLKVLNPEELDWKWKK